MQEHLKEIQQAGAQVVAVSYDSVEVLNRFAKQRDITFPLLSDPQSETIKAYGILNEEVSGSRLRGIPYPGTFVIGTNGVIQTKLFLEGYKDRHDTSALLEALKSEP